MIAHAGFYLTPSRWFCKIHTGTMMRVRYNHRVVTGRDLETPRIYCPRCGFVNNPRPLSEEQKHERQA